MNMHTDPLNEKGQPEKIYREEMAGQFGSYKDTPAESDARDAAKIEKAQSGQSQKMDGIDPEEIDDGSLAEEIRRETLENK